MDAYERVQNILASIKTEIQPQIEFSWVNGNQNDVSNWRLQDSSSPGSSTSEAAPDRWSKERKAWILLELEKGNLLLAPFREGDDFFSRVTKPTGERVAVQCNMCKTLLSPNAGGQYNYHRTACPQRQIPKEKLQISPYPINATNKKTVIQSIAKLCAMDFLPFSIVEGSGFRAFVNDVLQFGFNAGVSVVKNKEKYSAPNVDDYLPQRSAVDRFIDDYISIKLPAFNELIERSIKNHGGAISMKSLIINSRGFVQVAVHFIDEFWRLHAYTIDIVPCIKRNYMDSLSKTLSKRGLDFPNVHTKSQIDLFAEHGLTLVVNLGNVEITWLADRLDGMEDRLSNFCYWIINPQKLEEMGCVLDKQVKEELIKVKSTIDDAKEVIKELSKSLETKNNLAASVLKELNKPGISCKKSIELFLELIEICHQPGLLIDLRVDLPNQDLCNKFDSVINNLRDLRDYVTAIGSIEYSIKNLRREHEPTLCSILLELETLRKEFKSIEQNSDSSAIKALGKAGIQLIKNQIEYEINDLHTNAFILDPANKNNLRFLLPSAERFQKAKEAFRKSVLALRPSPTEEPQIDQDFDELDSFDGLPPSTSNNLGIDPIEIEIKNYLGLSKTQAENYESVLDFWKANETTYPTIAKLAKRVLCIPACVISEDGTFNLLNGTGKETSAIDPETISKLVNTVALQKFCQVMA